MSILLCKLTLTVSSPSTKARLYICMCCHEEHISGICLDPEGAMSYNQEHTLWDNDALALYQSCIDEPAARTAVVACILLNEAKEEFPCIKSFGKILLKHNDLIARMVASCRHTMASSNPVCDLICKS